MTAFIFDWVSLKQLPSIVKRLVGVVAACLLVFAVVMVCITPAKFQLPSFTLPLGGCLLPVSLGLLVYSLFIDIPFRSTYADQGVGDKLMTTGTYALTRHPGVIWLTFVFLSLILLFPSTTLLLATVIWLIMDVIHVTLQDKLLFPKMFPGYHEYQRQTPFLIPTRQSLLACLRTARPRAKSGS